MYHYHGQVIKRHKGVDSNNITDYNILRENKLDKLWSTFCFLAPNLNRVSIDMDAMPLQFKRYDLVEVDGYRGYVNCICIATKSHLHKTTPSSYFTLTIEGTEGTVRAVNVLIFRNLWSSVKVIQSYVEPNKQDSDLNLEGVSTCSHEEYAEGALLGI